MSSFYLQQKIEWQTLIIHYAVNNKSTPALDKATKSVVKWKTKVRSHWPLQYLQRCCIFVCISPHHSPFNIIS